MYVYVYMPEDKTFGEFYEKKICQKEKNQYNFKDEIYLKICL